MFVKKDDRIIYYSVEIKNNKNTYIKFKDNKLVIITNKYVKNSKIISYIEENFDYLYSKILKVKKSETTDSLLENNKVAFLGKKYNIVHKKGDFNYEIINNDLIIYSKYDLLKSIHLLYKKTITEEINIIKEEVELAFNNKFKPTIVIKKLTTCFGNNYYKKNLINMSYFLAKYNLKYTKYVLYHEYCHFVVQSHSKDFYNIFDQVFKNHRLYEKELKRIVKIISLK